MFMQTVFSKIHPACHNIANGSNQEITLKRLLNMLPIIKSCILGRKVIFVGCINCSYNNVAKGIRLLDVKAIFVYTGKNLNK